MAIPRPCNSNKTYYLIQKNVHKLNQEAFRNSHQIWGTYLPMTIRGCSGCWFHSHRNTDFIASHVIIWKMNKIAALETEGLMQWTNWYHYTVKTRQLSYCYRIHQLNEQQKDLHKQGKHLLWLFQSHQCRFLCSRATGLYSHVFAWSVQPFKRNSCRHSKSRTMNANDKTKMNGKEK